MLERDKTEAKNLTTVWELLKRLETEHSIDSATDFRIRSNDGGSRLQIVLTIKEGTVAADNGSSHQ